MKLHKVFRMKGHGTSELSALFLYSALSVAHKGRLHVILFVQLKDANDGTRVTEPGCTETQMYGFWNSDEYESVQCVVQGIIGIFLYVVYHIFQKKTRIWSTGLKDWVNH